MKRKEEAAVVDGRADALARFADGRVGQADDGHGRRGVGLIARRRQINLDVDEVCVDAVDGGRLCMKEHGESAPLKDAEGAEEFRRGSVRENVRGSGGKGLRVGSGQAGWV